GAGAGRPDLLDQTAQRFLSLRRRDAAVRAVAAGSGYRAGEHGGQRRLVDLEDQVGTGDAASHVREVTADPRGQRLGHVPASAMVGQQPIASWTLDGRGQAERTERLDLEPAL